MCKNVEMTLSTNFSSPFPGITIYSWIFQVLRFMMCIWYIVNLSSTFNLVIVTHSFCQSFFIISRLPEVHPQVLKKKKSLWAIYEQYIPWVIANLNCLPVSFILDIIELHVMSWVTFEELHCSTVIHHWRAQGHFQHNENYLYDTVCEQMSYFTVTSLRQPNMLLLLQSLSSTLPHWQNVLWKYCSYVGLEIKPNPRKLPLPFQGPTSHFCKNRCVGLHLCFCLLF